MTAPDGRTRLLLLTNTVQIGGMEEHVRLLARDLDREHFSVHVVFPEWEATDWYVPRLEEAADEVVQITPDRRPGGRGAVREAVRLYRYVRARGFDVAHFHSTTYRGQLFALLAVRAAGVRRVLVTEHLAPEKPLPPWESLPRRLAASLLTDVVAVSENNRRQRARFLPTPADSTHVVDNGVDPAGYLEPLPQAVLDEARAEAGLAPDDLVVGTAIRFEPGKGVADLVAGFAQVHATRPRARLLLVGDGRLRAELEAQVRELGIADAVVFAGFQTEPRAWIELMDVFVIPVPYGSASIGLLEAMMMERPCVISFGSPGEAVVPGEHGFWATPHDPSSIAEHVGWLLDHDEERREMGRRARARVIDDFSAARVARRLGEIYRSAATV